MPNLSKDTANTICRALRAGTVPESGLEHYAVGLDKQISEICKGLDEAARGKSDCKFIRGDYGSGKTFLCSLAAAEAADRGFVVSKVVISGTDARLYRLDEVYKKLCSNFRVNGVEKSLKAILGTWLYQLEEQLIDIDQIAEDAPNFQHAFESKVDSFLNRVGDKAGRFSACVKTYQRLLAQDDYQNANAIVDWLGGDSHVSAKVTKLAGIKGDIKNQDVFAFLKAFLEIISQSGNRGLLLILDEVETTSRLNRPEIRKGLQVLRQLLDAIAQNEYPGLYLLVTGTPDFFEGPKGVPLEPPLYDRIRVEFKEHEPDNLRLPQIRLNPFDDSRLKLVAEKIRRLFPAENPERVAECVDDEFTERLVQHFTSAFGGKVSVTPRLFLRELVNQMDKVDQNDDYKPKERFQFDSRTLENLSPEEEESLQGVFL